MLTISQGVVCESKGKSEHGFEAVSGKAELNTFKGGASTEKSSSKRKIDETNSDSSKRAK